MKFNSLKLLSKSKNGETGINVNKNRDRKDKETKFESANTKAGRVLGRKDISRGLGLRPWEGVQKEEDKLNFNTILETVECLDRKL